MIRRNFIALLTFLCLCNVCFSQTKRAPSHLLALNSKNDFDLIKGEPLSKNFNGIECIKIVYVLATKKLYYLESKRYKWHYRFVSEILGDQDVLDEFNQKNYSNTSARKYILATFNYNVNTKNYFLQFAACDNPSDELINILTQKVASTFFLKDQFKVLLNSTVLMRRKEELSKKYTILTSDDLYKNQNYQPICSGKASGILTFVNADSLKQNVNYSNAILVINGTSNQLPVCKAIITNEFQTPLSHICLLTNNRKTPCAALKNIFEIDSLKAWKGKVVEINVGDEHLSLNPNVVVLPNKKSVKRIVLVADTGTKTIKELTHLHYKNKTSYGSKACNLAELKRVKYKGELLFTPKNALAVPFYFYTKHIKSNSINEQIRLLLNDSVALNSDSILEKRLKQIRTSIKRSPINPLFLHQLEDMCFQNFGKKKVRFRSSSNCEDETGFNGAGLYTSETGIPGDTSKSIEAAVKKVWASLWTPRAFRERHFFNIDHSSVAMAILVHEAVDDEIINGVAITKNLYRSYDFGFVINIQKGEEEVVSPKKGVVCEQVVSYMNNAYADFYNKYRSADWISYSSFSPELSLLSADELLLLSQQLDSIKRYFYYLYKKSLKTEYKDFGMDVEFKLIETPDKKRTFLFKQARPYYN